MVCATLVNTIPTSRRSKKEDASCLLVRDKVAVERGSQGGASVLLLGVVCCRGAFYTTFWVSCAAAGRSILLLLLLLDAAWYPVKR